jgi:chaperonin cofactor prefoldin
MLATEMQQLSQSRAQLLQQSNENRMVLEVRRPTTPTPLAAATAPVTQPLAPAPLQELSRLDDDANIFKLIGPALIKQDQLEAKSNVQKRLDYIKGELTRVDGQITALEAKATDKQTEVGAKEYMPVVIVIMYPCTPVLLSLCSECSMGTCTPPSYLSLKCTGCPTHN